MEKSFKEELTKEEVEKQSNEWLLDKWVWMNSMLGAIVTEEKKNVKSEILRRMGDKEDNQCH